MSPLIRQSNTRNVPPESVVLMHFMGYGTDGEPQFVFQFHTPPVSPLDLPMHDHRSNLPRHGGFPFAVYSTGSALPQQEFPV